MEPPHFPAFQFVVLRFESCWAGSYSMEETMVSLHPEYVVDEKDKRRAVVLPVEEWEKVIDELEELEDIRLYDAAKQDTGEAVPFEQAVKEIEQDGGR